MAVRVTEAWSPQAISKGPDGWTGRREFDVTGVANLFDALTAVDPGTGLAVPQVNDVHPFTDRLIVRVPGSQRPGFKFFRIAVDYVEPEQGEFVGDKDDPLDQPARLRWRFGIEMVEVDRDRDGNPILNSARDANQKNPTRPEPTAFLSVTRFQPFFAPSVALAYGGKLNSDAFKVEGVQIAPKQTARVQSIQPVSAYVLSAPFVEVEHSFEFRGDGFDFRRMDLGLRAVGEKNGGDVPLALFDQAGKQVTSDVRLDGHGAPLNADYKIGLEGATASNIDSPPGATIDATADAVFLLWKLSKELPFAVLGL